VSLLDFVLPFIVVLGVLIFVHELGHFIAAKACGVKVERFSLGFGRAIASRTVGETEYRVAWLPLGGYVKMLGEIPGEEMPQEDADRSFNAKPVWQRIVIAVAGPGMNFALPVLLLGAAYMVGVPTATSRLGTILPSSAAEQAGVQAGDRLVAVGGTGVEWWEDVSETLGEATPGPVPIEVDRGGTRIHFTLDVPPEGGDPVDLGLLPSAPAAVIALRSEETPAFRAGLRTGDQITHVAGEEVADWPALVAALESAGSAPGRRVELEIARANEGEVDTLRLTLEVKEGGRALGLLPGDLRIHDVEPESPAATAGLEGGDLLVEVDGRPVSSFRALAERIRRSGGEPVPLGILRDGELRRVVVVPEQRDIVERGLKDRVFAIGVRGGIQAQPELLPRRTSNPVTALAMGAGWTAEITVRIFEGIGMLVSGRVGRENLAGPIGIGVIAAQSFQAGWVQGILMMAVISVNLAILNLLPIPVLDGGQIVFALAEGLKGKPVSFRIREVAQQIGIALLLCLMVFAFWNDLARHWSDILSFFQGAP
jgi:regulator of sigma E protease